MFKHFGRRPGQFGGGGAPDEPTGKLDVLDRDRIELETVPVETVPKLEDTELEATELLTDDDTGRLELADDVTTELETVDEIDLLSELETGVLVTLDDATELECEEEMTELETGTLECVEAELLSECGGIGMLMVELTFELVSDDAETDDEEWVCTELEDV